MSVTVQLTNFDLCAIGVWSNVLYLMNDPYEPALC